MDVILSTRGQEKFAHDGFCYVFDKWSKDGETRFWRCERRQGCKGRIHTNGNMTNVIIRHAHDHDANAAVIEVQVIKNTIKRQAAATQETTSQVLKAATRTISRARQAQLPHINAQRKLVQRIRTANIAAPPTPRDTNTLVIPQQFTEYERSPENTVRFLLADSGAGEDRVLIFGTDVFADVMSRSTVWFGDGTFSITPPLFSQVYTILAETMGNVLPILYCILPNKNEQTYERMFEMIKDLRPAAAPAQFNCDYELAAINAVSRAFPDCQVCGCFFHLVRNIKKHIGNEGLLRRYNADGDFQLLCRMISALAFVPVADIGDRLDELSLLLPAELQPVLSYFEDNYVGRPMRVHGGGRRPALFNPAIWSVYDRTLAGTHRTNNFAEAAHRRIQCEIGMDHPTLWKFIDALRKVQKGRESFHESLIRGDDPPTKLRKYRRADERILTVVRDYANRTTDDYLRGIAHNYEMNP